MISIHEHSERYFRSGKDFYYKIIQLGCGGTGSNIVQHIAQILSLTEHNKFDYTIVDPDILEEKNLKNQLFLENEVGEKKSDILAERYSDAFDFTIYSYSEKYIESVEDFEALLNMSFTKAYYSNGVIPIIIGAVDNNATRKILHNLFNKLENVIYIDSGNDAINMPSDWRTRTKDKWTEAEIQLANDSGWNGQVCCGLRLNNKTILKPVAEQFYGILDDNDTILPSLASCSELAASEPQRIFVNKMSAFIVGNMINEVLNSFTITNHYSIFNAKNCFIRSCEAEISDDTIN